MGSQVGILGVASRWKGSWASRQEMVGDGILRASPESPGKRHVWEPEPGNWQIALLPPSSCLVVICVFHPVSVY